jgi:hypothetical protein
MATVSQLKLQLGSPVKYTNGEAVSPPALPEEPQTPKLVITQGVQEEGTDLGVIKVEDGKFVLDMDDFSPDFGTF